MKIDEFANKVERHYSKETNRSGVFTPDGLSRWIEVIMDLMTLCQKPATEMKKIAEKPNLVQRIRLRRVLQTHFQGESRQELNERADSLCKVAVETPPADLTSLERDLEL